AGAAVGIGILLLVLFSGKPAPELPPDPPVAPPDAASPARHRRDDESASAPSAAADDRFPRAPGDPQGPQVRAGAPRGSRGSAPRVQRPDAAGRQDRARRRG